MYMRFVVPRKDLDTGVESGFFRGVFAVRYGGYPAPDWLRAEVARELDWFNVNLDVPSRLTRRSGRFGDVRGVCWFAPAAGEAVSRARYCSWLLEEVGIPVREVRSGCPGEIIWRDEMQVVAKPARDHPRAFH